MTICSFPLCIFVTIYAKPIISFLFGNEFVGATIPFQICIWTLIALFINILNENILTAQKRQKLLLISNSLCLFIIFSVGFLSYS